MARGGGWAVMIACFSFTAQRLKPSLCEEQSPLHSAKPFTLSVKGFASYTLSHGRTRAELKFTEGRGRHVSCFAAGFEGLCFNGTATFLL